MSHQCLKAFIVQKRVTVLFSFPRQGRRRGNGLESEREGWRLDIKRNFLSVRDQRTELVVVKGERTHGLNSSGHL